MIGNKIQLVLALAAGSLILSSSYLGFAWADAGQNPAGNVQVKATDAIKNDPKAMSILQTIELFKQQYAAQQQKQTIQDQQNQLVEQQRKLAQQYLQADIASVNQQNDASVSSAYAGFVSKVNSPAQGVFMDEFAYMQQKVAQGRLAMNQEIQNGGTHDQALDAFNSGAATQKTDLVSVNKATNVKYNLSDGTVQDLFDKYGNLKKYSAY
ncbi:MAG: hypothetical protein KGH76_03480 [Thaumarchaeota archaeon]|nr:hypothetical protein [Nitrososphaerota archaeon]